MMKILQMTFSGLLVVLPLFAHSQSKGWRGIVPLHSTRADVIRLLGPPNLDGDLYDLDNKTVHIEYSDGPCEKLRTPPTSTGGWVFCGSTTSVTSGLPLKFFHRVWRKRY